MTNRSPLRVDVQFVSDDSGVPSANDIELWVTRTFVATGKNLASPTELSVRVVDTEEIRRLNRDFRQRDKATNVLSFPAGKIEGLPPDAMQMLGDVVVCASVVAAEAAGQGKPLDDHWAHMLVHGTLHVLGFDHETADEAAGMERLETDILTAFGVADPYEESR